MKPYNIQDSAVTPFSKGEIDEEEYVYRVHWGQGFNACYAQALARETELRRLLALSYSGHLLYGDDGELQDSTAHPFIDFKRDDPTVIAAKMVERAAKVAQTDPRELIAKQAANLVDGAELFGLEVRISTRPLYPLAMGNHAPVIEVSLLNRIYRNQKGASCDP